MCTSALVSTEQPYEEWQRKQGKLGEMNDNVINFGPHARPRPPREMAEGNFEVVPPRFLAAPELVEWARAVFVDPAGPLYNSTHEHLEGAMIGALWTTVSNSRHGR